MSGYVSYQVEYRSLNWDAVPVNHVARKFGVSPWEGITEQDALQQARAYANDLRKYHLFVDIWRIGPRGGRKPVS